MSGAPEPARGGSGERAEGPGDPFGGLCPRCRHVHRVQSSRGSVFYRCRLERTDPRYPRYPPQPVRRCAGHEPA